MRTSVISFLASAYDEISPSILARFAFRVLIVAFRILAWAFIQSSSADRSIV